MKDQFIGFYELKPGEVDEIWESGIFIFDANSLLNLYRYSSQTSNDFLQILNKLKDQLFLPHQVGYEFHNNRHIVIDTINNSYELLLNEFNKEIDNAFDKILNKHTKHPIIKINELKKTKEKFLNEFKGELLNQKKSHVDYFKNDSILDQLTNLFENKVGSEFSDEELEVIYSEGSGRYIKKIPPGYKDTDKKNNGDRHLYGDLIIWKQIINFSKQEKKAIIFITDDRKEDWWQIEHGKTIRPRQELIFEFFKETGIRILIYNADKFMKYAKDKKVVKEIKQKSIKEIMDIRIDDVAYLSNYEILNSQSQAIYIKSLESEVYKLNKNLGIIDANIYTNPSSLNVANLPNMNEYIYNSGTLGTIITSQRSALDLLYNNDFIAKSPLNIKLSDDINEKIDYTKPITLKSTPPITESKNKD